MGQTLRLRYFTPKMIILCQPASQQHYRAIIIIKRTLISSSAIPFHHLPNDRLLIGILSYSSNYNWVHFSKSLFKTQHFWSSSYHHPIRTSRYIAMMLVWCGVLLMMIMKVIWVFKRKYPSIWSWCDRVINLPFIPLLAGFGYLNWLAGFGYWDCWSLLELLLLLFVVD